MWALLTLTLTAGAVAAFNPCGFAMLPAYLGYFVSQESDEETNVGRNIIRGLTVGLTITAGFVSVFTLIGVITQTFVSASSINQHLPKLTFAFGILLIPLGLAMLFLGVEPRINLPRLQKGGRTRGFGSMYMFGVSYALVSLSCTAPIFFGTVIGSFTQGGGGFFRGLAAFVGYALGMGMVVMSLTLATAMARNELATFFRKMLPFINRVSGALLFLAGIFLVLYAWWEIQVLRGNNDTNWLIEQSELFQATISNWMADVGGLRLTMALGLLFGTALLFAFRKNVSNAVFGLGLAALGAFWVAGEALSGKLFDTLFKDFGAGEFLARPIGRTVASIPERVGNWFIDPFRPQTFFEGMLALVIVSIVTLRVRKALSKEAVTNSPAATDSSDFLPKLEPASGS